MYKLHVPPAVRYSEDIDLVQVTANPIGATLEAIRGTLDPWLGEPRRAIKEGSATLVYRTQTEGVPLLPLRLKIEINTREHFSVFGLERHRFGVQSRWFSGSASVSTYALDELLGTKLRALYQRKKGRDLFDLWYAGRRGNANARRIVACFLRYLEHSGQRISRAEFEANLEDKLADPAFLGDISPLLAPNSGWNLADAARYAREELLSRLPGNTWKGSTVR